jgi:ribosome-associated heat shock protein Hsp15
MAERAIMSRPERESASTAASARVRLDKWLWAARFYRTRSLAAQAIDAGQVRLNEERAKPAHPVRAGDTVTVRRHGLAWVVAVAAVSDRRGGAPEAAKLYAETAASATEREEELLRRRAAATSDPRTDGRPTKRDRRKLEDFLAEP